MALERIKQLIQKHRDLLFILIVLFFGLLLNGLVYLIFQPIGLEYLQLDAVLQLAMPFVYAVMLFILVKHFELSFSFKCISVKPNIVIAVLVLFVVVFIVQEAIDVIFVKELINGNLNFLDYRTPLKHGMNPILSDFSAIILAPIFEEILYRRIIFQKLKNRYGVRLGIIISSVLFSLLHLRRAVFSPNLPQVVHRPRSIFARGPCFPEFLFLWKILHFPDY